MQSTDITRPHRPPPDDVDRYMRFTPDQRRAYDQWRYVKEIRRYWHQRERELRPPELVLLALLLYWCRRQWRNFVRAVSRGQ